MRSVKQCSFGAIPVSIQPSAFDTLIFLLVLHCDINRFLDLWVFSNIFVDIHHQYLANLVGFDGFTAVFFFSNWLMRVGSVLPGSLGGSFMVIGGQFAVLKQVNIGFSRWQDEDPVKEIRMESFRLLVRDLNDRIGAPVEQNIIEGVAFDLVFQDGATKISLGIGCVDRIDFHLVYQ
jgi:hypothetical protein